MTAINRGSETADAKGHRKAVTNKVMDNINVSVQHSEMVCASMGACETKSIPYARSRVHFNHNAELIAISSTMNGKYTRA